MTKYTAEDSVTCDGCPGYLPQDKLELLHQKYTRIFPLDVEWKNCVEGPEKWLNCRRRKRPPEKAEDL